MSLSVITKLVYRNVKLLILAILIATILYQYSHRHKPKIIVANDQLIYLEKIARNSEDKIFVVKISKFNQHFKKYEHFEKYYLFAYRNIEEVDHDKLLDANPRLKEIYEVALAQRCTVEDYEHSKFDYVMVVNGNTEAEFFNCFSSLLGEIGKFN